MKNKKPEIIEVPDSRAFANTLIISLMQENGISVKTEGNEDPLDVVLSIPEIHADFTAWLCDLVREHAYAEIGAPVDAILN